MPLNTNLDTPPYWNDYSPNSQYYRVLFKPRIPVQARELLTLQDMLQNQIEKFGDWAFQNGDIVSGCAVTDIPVMPYLLLQDQQTNGASYAVGNFVNCVAISASTNVMAKVLLSVPGTESSYPNTATVYLKYLNTGTSGQQTFSNTDTVTFYRYPLTGNTLIDVAGTVLAYQNTTSNTFSTGNGHGISVSAGIVYLDGQFTTVLTPTLGIVQPYSTDAGNNQVGFQSVESIVTYNQDISLLDNAQGYPNYNAPGADRLKITPTLITLTQNSASTTSGFNPIAVYNYGSLISVANSTSNVYSIVASAIATRIYEESGNFVVNPFVVDTISSSNSIVANITANSVLARVGTGVGYAQGSRVQISKTAYVNMRRGVDTRSLVEQQISFNYGSYDIIDEVSGIFPSGNYPNTGVVYLYDTPQQSVTNRTYSNISTPVGNLLGNATARCFTYAGGTPGTNGAQYYLHLTNINVANGVSASQVKSVFSNAGGIIAVGDVASGLMNVQGDNQLYSFGVPGLMNLRDSSNNNITEFTWRANTTTILSSSTHTLTVTIPGSAAGGTDILPYGVGGLSDFEASTFTVSVLANGQSAYLAGTLSAYNTSTNVVGSGTSFMTNFSAGAEIIVGTDVRTVALITNNTFLQVDSAFSANTTGSSYARYYSAGKILPISSLALDAPSYVNVTNTTSFTITTGTIANTNINCGVVYNTLRTVATPISKAIMKNRYVQIDTTKNPNGPWCLGYPDVHQVTAIWGAASNTYSASGVDVTGDFVFDSGGRDSTYGLGYLYSVAGVPSYPYLTVQLDYFAANTATGVGFFSVESYPIDDANTANVNAIQTKNIPIYVDSSGARRWLRDYVDFRIPVLPTANDTGVANTANSASVTAAIGYASYNPSSNLTYVVPATGIHPPAYGQGMQANYTQYLSRQDLIIITPDGVLKIKEGVSATSPQAPLYPDNAMALAAINIPPFPSLASDEVDAAYAQNQTSRNTCRDVTTAITCSLVTNRGYNMSDIGKLDARISHLEYYAELSQLQQTATNMVVTDANGNQQFKNGIFTDPMSSFTYCDVSDPDFSVAIDASGGVARPKIWRETLYMRFNSGASPGVQLTGRCVTLPYSEVPYLVQPYATGYRSAALVAFAWNGTMLLIPSYSNFYDVSNTGSINITINNAQAWSSFANSAFGTTWGDWSVVSNSVSTSVLTGPAVINVSLGYTGHDDVLTDAQIWTMLEAKGITPTGYTLGTYSVYWDNVDNPADLVLTVANTGQVTYAGGGNLLF